MSYTKLVSKPSQWKLHLNRMMVYIQKFYPYFQKCFSGIFPIALGKPLIKVMIKLMNSQILNAILSLDSTTGGTTTELGSKDTFLWTWNSLLFYN